MMAKHDANYTEESDHLFLISVSHICFSYLLMIFTVFCCSLVEVNEVLSGVDSFVPTEYLQTKLT